MSNLSWNWYWSESSGSSWREYLRQSSIVDAINAGTGATADYMGSCINSQTREIIGSVESMQESLEAGLAGVNCNLSQMRVALNDLDRTFTWGFSSMLAAMGGMQTTFDELLKIAKTPAQTASYEQFEIARDAYRKGLYPECLEALKFAIDGVPGVSPGYKLEWRFHQLRGLVLLGSFGNHDSAHMDPCEAEKSFLLAARYARQDFALDAAKAFLSAGWSAYVQAEGRKEKLSEALTYTELAAKLDPGLAEALFQQAKIEMALGQPDVALPHLKRAIDFGGLFVAKAAADGDFHPYDLQLWNFFEMLRQEKICQVQELVQPFAEKLRPFAQKHSNFVNHPAVVRFMSFVDRKTSEKLITLADFTHGFKSVLAEISEIRIGDHAQLPTKMSLQPTGEMRLQPTGQTETYIKEVVHKGGWFSSDSVEKVQCQRPAMAEVPIMVEVPILSYEWLLKNPFHDEGKINVVVVPPGKVLSKNKYNQREVTIDHSFEITKTLITKQQYQMLLGRDLPTEYDEDGPTVPIRSINWFKAVEFCNALSRICGLEKAYLIIGKLVWLEASGYAKGGWRLPTEDEWEYACRAGDTRPQYGEINDIAWHKNNSQNRPHAVGEKVANQWGIFDMLGNVDEWCWDEREGNRVTRGGSFNTNEQDLSAYYSSNWNPDWGAHFLGFRCVRTV